MADLPAYSREELDQTARNLLRTRRRGIDLGFGSDWDLNARLLGSLAWIMFEQSKIANRLLVKSAAFGEYLRQYAFESGIGRGVEGVTTAAVKARGKVIIRSTTGSQTQLAGSVLRHADGTSYTLDADVTTPATATKVLRAGHRSGRQRLYQGHAGGGFVAAAAGEVYQFAGTGELCALRDVENGVDLQRHLFDLYNDLDADPEIHDQFAQQIGAVGSITAVVAGAAGNKDAKDVLTIESPVGTVLAEATILYLGDGDDVMTPSRTQQALRDLLSIRAGAMTMVDLRSIALEYPRASIRECYVIPATSGVGTYTLLPILEQGQYVGAAMLADIVDYVQAQLPDKADKLAGASIYEVVDAEFATMSVHVTNQYPPDWELPDPSSQGLDVVSSTSTELEFADASAIPAGSRVIVANFGASGPYIVQRLATAVDTGTDVITLDQPLPFPADAGDCYVTPGGPLGDAIIESIYAAYEARPPRVGASGAGVRYPPATVGDTWHSIVAAVSRVPGVTDADYVYGTDPVFSDPGAVFVPAMSIIMHVERSE